MLTILSVMAGMLAMGLEAHALTPSTWGEIKATFARESTEGLSTSPLLTGAAYAPVLCKKNPGTESTGSSDMQTQAFISALEGGTVELDGAWGSMKLEIEAGALSDDLTVGMYIEQDLSGAVWFVVEGLPDRICTPSAELEIEVELVLSEVDVSTLALVHQTVDGWETVDVGIAVQVDQEDDRAEIEVKSFLPKFSRYALAGSPR